MGIKDAEDRLQNKRKIEEFKDFNTGAEVCGLATTGGSRKSTSLWSKELKNTIKRKKTNVKNRETKKAMDNIKKRDKWQRRELK